MEIKNLKDTSLSDIVRAISASFADYFVQLSSEVSYWEKRFTASRVNYELSYGMFEDGQLVGFIINGIDEAGGVKTAFNTGTGVMASSRGHKIIDQLYQYALPYFKAADIRQCTLEVISQNERAIHVYERIGFRTTRELKCFKGTLSVTEPEARVQQVPFADLAATVAANDPFYSWDHTGTAVAASNGHYQCYRVSCNGVASGYFILNPDTGHIIQFEAAAPDTWRALLSGIASIRPEVKINNVNGSRAEVIAALQAAGLDNFIDQYEMQMSLN